MIDLLTLFNKVFPTQLEIVIVILKPDKEHGVVVLDREMYDKSVLNLTTRLWLNAIEGKQTATISEEAKKERWDRGQKVQ